MKEKIKEIPLAALIKGKETDITHKSQLVYFRIMLRYR